MSNDKYLSKPVCTVDVQRDRADGNTFAVAWSSAGHSLPDGPHFLHSQEYVQSLLKRIAELEAERETMHSIEYVSGLLAHIAVLERENIKQILWVTGLQQMRDDIEKRLVEKIVNPDGDDPLYIELLEAQEKRIAELLSENNILLQAGSGLSNSGRDVIKRAMDNTKGKNNEQSDA